MKLLDGVQEIVRRFFVFRYKFYGGFSRIIFKARWNFYGGMMEKYSYNKEFPKTTITETD